jgi:hypothetical protein
VSKRERRCKNDERAFISKSSGIGRKDTKVNLALPLSAYPTVQISSEVAQLLINGVLGNWLFGVATLR